MRETKEWGEFFPATLSPYPINETVNQLYHPLSEEEARHRGWWWSEESHDIASAEGKGVMTTEVATLDPEDLRGVVLLCSDTGRPFRLIQQEIALYNKMGVPFPLQHPDLRHKRRWGNRHPYEMYTRNCAYSGVLLHTSYPPSSPYTIISNERYRLEFDS